MRPGHMRHSTENDPSSLSSFTFASLPSEVAEKEEDKTINVKRAIGSGAFGVVYLAEYGRERQLVAVKKVLQDKRYKVYLDPHLPVSETSCMTNVKSISYTEP